jgi:Rrf2 family protein
MKITAQEEYGLRILIRIASCKDAEGMSIPQLSEAEGITPHYVAKLTRLLRLEGFINSTPGNKGGYVLARDPKSIGIKQVLKSLGGVLYDTAFCASHGGSLNLCTNSPDCSSRSLWKMIQFTVDQLLDKVSLYELVNTEKESAKILNHILEQNIVSFKARESEKL